MCETVNRRVGNIICCTCFSTVKEKSRQRDWRISTSIIEIDGLGPSIFHLPRVSCHDICVFGIVGYKVMMYTANGPSHCFFEETVPPALSIDTQIADLVAKMPGNPIGPALDARGGRFVNKDVAAYDQLVALAIVWLTEAVRQGAIDTIFDDGDRALSVVDAGLTGRNIRWPSITHVDCH